MAEIQKKGAYPRLLGALRWCGKEGGLYANIVEASRAIFVRLTEIQLICRVIDKILFHAMSLAQLEG